MQLLNLPKIASVKHRYAHSVNKADATLVEKIVYGSNYSLNQNKYTINCRPNFVLDCCSERSHLPKYDSINDQFLKRYHQKIEARRAIIKKMLKVGITLVSKFENEPADEKFEECNIW